VLPRQISNVRDATATAAMAIFPAALLSQVDDAKCGVGDDGHCRP
jgi:hypothetical protein